VHALESLKGIELGDTRLLQRAVELRDADIGADTDRSVEHPADRQPTQIFAVVEVGHEKLKRRVRISGRSGNALRDRFKQRLQVCAIAIQAPLRDSGARVRVDDGKVELFSDASRSMNRSQSSFRTSGARASERSILLIPQQSAAWLRAPW